MAPNVRCAIIAATLTPALLVQAAHAQASWTVTSPDGRIQMQVRLAEPDRTGAYPPGKTRLYYQVAHDRQAVLAWSPLGISRSDQDFVDGLAFVEAGAARTIDETYTIPHGKRRTYRNHANEQTLLFRNANGARVELVVRAYNDGVAFRYRFPEQSQDRYTVTSEQTGFRLPPGGKVWAHPYDRATKYTPAYETYYVNGVDMGTASPIEAGWAFPVLACTADRTRWLLVTEAGLDPSYCGSRLEQNAPDGVYRIRFPEEAEGDATGQVEPSWTLPWATPWRVVIVGDSLGTIVESTLVTDVSPPSAVKDTSWIQAGRASWSWLSDHASPQDFNKLKAFVDLAVEMGWEYSLVDANWDRMRNGTIHDLAAYANSKGVALLLWYNSGGPHNHVSEKPRGLMDHREIRREEFQIIRKWGVRGVKVDFFQSDKQNMIQLYHDILQDAAEAQIMVNFHGCTLPRGWSRTYPHLMTMEAVRGAECYSFDKRFTAEAPIQNTITPFTRNVVGPMDCTPVQLADIRYPHLTTYGHELALPIVFESGWLHFADKVSSYRDLPEVPKEFLKNVPVAWDETKFIEGDPGEYVVLARRSGQSWYVGGINGQDSGRDVAVTLPFLGQPRYTVTVITDGDGPRNFRSETQAVTPADPLEIRLLPYGGFVAVLTPCK
jgi:alpha-glucosidase